MATILMLRHGQIRANVQGLWHGSTDSKLNWRGRRQARRTARHLAAEYPDISTIYTSPLHRCRRTAAAAAEQLGIDVVVHNELREYGIGEWEGMPFRRLASDYNFVRQAVTDLNFAPPGGETLRQVSDRVVDAIEDIHCRHETDTKVLIVSHGAAMAVALGSILNRDPARWTDYHFANCSLTELVLLPSPYVNYFNSTRHL